MSPSYLLSLEDNIKVDKDKCIFCGRCAERCILDNIRMKTAPCRQACPMGVNIQGYVQLIARGEYDQARKVVREQLPFPRIVCMVCDRPCENICEKGRTGGGPVSIRALKRFLFDFPVDGELPQKETPTGKRAAIAGAGPAGLVAAYDLALRGHTVTVYEAGSSAGGMLGSGIPPFRLPAEVLDRELAVLGGLGVVFKFNLRVGADVGLKNIMDEYDAVILAVGLAKIRRLHVGGEDLSGIYYGLPFLSASRQGKGPELFGTVLVAGGGNMAVDAAMTALRQGADRVAVLTLESEDELPAFDAELRQARKEGVTFRHSCGVERIEGKKGKMTGLVLNRCVAVFNADGDFAPQFEAPHESIAADALIIAIGQERDHGILKNSGLNPQDIHQADALTLQCAQSKVFAAGDYKGNGGSIIKAMAAGREAAESAARFMMGEHLRFERAYPGPILTEFPIEHDRGEHTPRNEPVTRPLRGKGDYGVLEQIFTEEQAKAEASRCHSCGGPCGQRTCWFCLPCEVQCPQKALWVEIPYLLR
jgi:formate dehydrogenase major subunit